MEKTDVLIIGGGPAGASLSHFLKDKNINSTVIERGGPERNKTCAGGLPIAVKSILPDYLQDFKKVEYDSLQIIHKSGLQASSSVKKVFTYGVLRAEFDAYLRNGLNVHYNESFLTYEEEKEGVIATTNKGKYRAKFIVGADGVGSRVSIVSGIAPKKRFIVAEEGEVPYKEKFNGTIRIFLGYNSIGYGWIFPKNGFLSVGSGAIRGRFKKDTVKKFFSGDYKTKIYPISLWGGPENLTRGRVALVGEAANLVDPFSAGGVYPAILSSYILSGILEKALKTGSSKISGYEELLESSIYEDFRYALFLSRIFYPFIPVIKKYVIRQSTIDLALELSSEGYISYRNIYKKVEQSKHLPLKLAYLLIKKLFK